MNGKSSTPSKLTLAIVGILALANSGHAQYFTSSKGDLLAGFRKNPNFQGNYELVVNLGNITNYEAIAAGASVRVSNFSPAQLSAAFSGYNNLQWSVFGTFLGSSAWAGFPANTLWYTQARSDVNTQSDVQARAPSSGQQQTKNAMLQVGSGAAFISSGFGTTNANNNSVLVREAAGDTLSGLTAGINDPSIPGLGNFQGTFFNVESVIPSSFTSPARSDLYQACPEGTTDPVMHLTTGAAYFVGYFQFNPDGTMSFTRASTNAPAPPQPMLSSTRNGGVSTISFLSASAATYTLCFTNAAAIGTSVTNWRSGASLGGNGSVTNFQDTTTDPDRVYCVKAH